MNSLFSYLIKSEFVRAQILAGVRHAVTALGTMLVLKGYADDSIVTGAVGLVTAVVSFWLSQIDVKKVDEKIKTALNTPVPNNEAVVVSIPTTEEEVTRQLNLAQHSGHYTPSAK